MAKVFDEILVKGVREGKIPAREQQARDWYRTTAKKFSGVTESSLMRSDRNRLKNRPAMGSMYFFMYDAKHKQTLPYWDRFPLIFPFEKAKGGFRGINLHYLPHPLRAQLMDALYDISNNDRYDESTKLKINYKILKNSSNLNYFKPCVKHYLRDHLKSRFLYVYPSEWDIALFLPLERFEKASKTKVWADSRKMVQ